MAGSLFYQGRLRVMVSCEPPARDRARWHSLPLGELALRSWGDADPRNDGSAASMVVRGQRSAVAGQTDRYVDAADRRSGRPGEARRDAVCVRGPVEDS